MIAGRFLVDEKAAAEMLGYTPRALQEWRRRGDGPQFVKVNGRSVRYRVTDLEEWAAERVRRSTADE